MEQKGREGGQDQEDRDNENRLRKKDKKPDMGRLGYHFSALSILRRLAVSLLSLKNSCPDLTQKPYIPPIPCALIAPANGGERGEAGSMTREPCQEMFRFLNKCRCPVC